jgi:hypothetical protein
MEALSIALTPAGAGCVAREVIDVMRKFGFGLLFATILTTVAMVVMALPVGTAGPPCCFS